MRRHGFTLVEMLVGILVFAIMAGISYRALNQIVTTQQRLEANNKKWRALALLFTRLQQDMMNVANRSIRDGQDLPEQPFLGKAAISGPLDAQLIFTRLGFAGQTGKLADAQRVGYRFANHKLELLIWPSLDQAPRSAPAKYELLADLNAFDIRYLGKDGAWHDQWPLPGVDMVHPRAVSVHLALSDGSQYQRLFRLP